MKVKVKWLHVLNVRYLVVSDDHDAGACKLAITVGERLDNDKLKDKTVEDEKSKKRHPNEYVSRFNYLNDD